MAKKLILKKGRPKAKPVRKPAKPLVRTERIDIKVTPAEKKALQAAAKRAGVSLTAFIVNTVK